MNTNDQNNFNHILNLLEKGEITVDQANVMKVRSRRILVVTKLRADVRRALNNAVKNGELGHVRKDGIKPEVYYHPSFEYLVNGVRNEVVRAAARAILATCS